MKKLGIHVVKSFQTFIILDYSKNRKRTKKSWKVIHVNIFILPKFCTKVYFIVNKMQIKDCISI